MGIGVLSLTIGERGGLNKTGFGRTIMPETVFDDFIRFDLNFIAKDNGNTDFSVTWTEGSGTVALNAGTWDLSVTAYLPDEDGNPVEAAKGNLNNIAIIAGLTVTENIPLSPVMTGSGVFSWVIGLPESVIAANMEIIPLDGNGNRDETSSYGGVYTFVENPANNNEIRLTGSLILGSGEYRVIFRLTNENEEASLSEILHVYQNMESGFAFTFTELHFPVSLLKVILAAWDNIGNEWRFAEAGIIAEHFLFLGIKGIDDNNFDEIVSRFNTLCAYGLVPGDLDGLKALVDASLVSIACENADFLDAGRYIHQDEAATAVQKLALNETVLDFAWETDNQTVTVKAGDYEITIVFTYALSGGFYFTLINNGTAYSVSRGNATAAIIVIPSVYEGLPVTEIANWGFSYYKEMTSVTIPDSVTSIGEGAFNNCTGLTSVTIPDNVTIIGEEAFTGCTGLTSVTIGNGVTVIGDGAFTHCNGLTSVTIGNGVTVIGKGAFSYCTGLTNVTIPDSVTVIGEGAFSGCTGLESLTIPFINEDFILIFNNAQTSLKTVIITGGNSIPNGAFWGFDNLTSVTIGNGVTVIGDAFGYCISLTSIIIPDSVTVIGGAFSGCTSLTSVTIGNGVTVIGDGAFSGCTGLESLTIPDSVTSIGDYAFSGCTGLENLTIPDSVTSIGDWAFYGCTSLRSVTIPDSVTVIGEYAFVDCTSLTNVIIGNGVTSIGKDAFWGCTSLESLTISFINGNILILLFHAQAFFKTIIITGGNSIPDFAFFGWTNLTSVTIPDSVTVIGEYAFSGCIYLTDITIPDSVTVISEGAFYGCTGLTSVTIPDSVTSIGSWAFYDCTGLTSVTIGNGVISIGSEAFANTEIWNNTSDDSIIYFNKWAIGYKGSITGNLFLKPDTIGIGEYAFSGCTGLTSVTIPDSVTVIGAGAFSGCIGLESITVKSGNMVYRSEGNCIIRIVDNVLIVGINNSIIPAGVTAIGDGAFSGCYGLTDITIPNSVTVIGHSAFTSSGLTSVTIPDNVTVIGDSAFAYCTSLTSVTIGNSVTSIGSNAFSHCTGLTSVTIPDSVTSIGDWAFNGCTGLTSITIGNGVTSIGVGAFQHCTGLTSITLGNSVTVIGDGAFYHCTGLTDINVNQDNQNYSSLDGVLYNKTQTSLILAPRAISGSFAIPDSVTAIGDYAFLSCISLTNITIPDSVTSIGNWAFQLCTSLTSITIGNRVTSIGGGAFSYCTGLTSVTIPDSVTSIGENTFYGCISLTSITILRPTPPTLELGVFSNTHSTLRIEVLVGSVNAYKTATYWWVIWASRIHAIGCGNMSYPCGIPCQ